MCCKCVPNACVKCAMRSVGSMGPQMGWGHMFIFPLQHFRYFDSGLLAGFVKFEGKSKMANLLGVKDDDLLMWPVHNATDITLETTRSARATGGVATGGLCDYCGGFFIS